MSAEGMEARRDRMETLLPRYLKGTLSHAERIEVEEWLASDPAAVMAIGEAEAGHSATATANEDIRPPMDVLSSLPTDLERKAGAERSERGSWLRRTGALIGALPPGVAWATAALALLLLTVQSIQVGPSQQETSSVAGMDGQTELPFVLVNFSDDTTISEISETMRNLGLTIVAGPMPGGLYRVSIPAETAAEYDEISASLQAAPTVVWLVAGSRPPDR